MSNLPSIINAVKTISYDVEQVAESIRVTNNNDDYEPTIEEILDYLEDWMMEDFDYDLTGVIVMDENGNEL